MAAGYKRELTVINGSERWGAAKLCHSGFTAKALQTHGVAHRRKSPIILTVPHNSLNSHHAPANAALHTADAIKNLDNRNGTLTAEGGGL